MITIHQRHRRTDGRTDGQTTCDRNTALCTKVHRAVKSRCETINYNTMPGVIYQTPVPAKISGDPSGVDPWYLGLKRANNPAKKLLSVSKYSNLCDHVTSTSQTDGRTDKRTDDLPQQYTAFYVVVASRGKNAVHNAATQPVCYCAAA